MDPEDQLDPSASPESEPPADPPEDAGGGPPDPEGASIADAVEQAIGRGRDGDGEPTVPAEEGEDGEAAPAAALRPEKAAAPESAAAPPAASPSGDLDLEPPAGISAKAKERFEKLATGYRESLERAEQLEAAHQPLVEAIRGTGASSEELGAAFEFVRLMHSRDPQDLEAAWQMMEHERTALATRLGKSSAAGVDFLSRHEDLRKAVEDLDITQERALELAMLRERMAQSESTTQATQARTAEQQHIEGLRGTLNQLQARLQASDADFGRKYAYLAEELPELVRLYGHDARALVTAVESRYQRIGNLMGAGVPARARPSRSRQAISHGSPGGAPPASPAKSTGEAIERAIGTGVDA